MPTSTGYSRLQIRLHWIILGLIVLQFLVAEPIEDAFDSVMRGEEFAFSLLIPVHVFGGLLVLVLGLVRLAVRLRHGAPAAPEEEAPLLRMVAHATHWLLYALMLMLPISGAAAWFGGVGAAGAAHGVAKSVLLVLVGLHALGALYQHFILKTDVLRRMITPKS